MSPDREAFEEWYRENRASDGYADPWAAFRAGAAWQRRAGVPREATEDMVEVGRRISVVHTRVTIADIWRAMHDAWEPK